MAVIDVAGFIADLKSHAVDHGFHVHDERHFVETYSLRQLLEVDLHPEEDCSGPIDSIIHVTGLTESALGYTLTWTSIPGQRYRLQYRDQLTDPTWKDVPGDVVATGITSEKTDGDTDERMRLYRVSRIE